MTTLRVCRRGHQITGRDCNTCARERDRARRRARGPVKDNVGAIPADRLLAAIQPILDRDGPHNVCHRTGVAFRQLWRIRHGESALVSWTIADQLLLGLDLNWLWTWPPEKGGFADLYVDEVAA